MKAIVSADKNKPRNPGECIIKRVEYGQRSPQAEHKLTTSPYDAMRNDMRTEELRSGY